MSLKQVIQAQEIWGVFFQECLYLMDKGSYVVGVESKKIEQIITVSCFLPICHHIRMRLIDHNVLEVRISLTFDKILVNSFTA